MSDKLPIVKHKYRSGNEGRKHPNLKYDGYFWGCQHCGRRTDRSPCDKCGKYAVA